MKSLFTIAFLFVSTLLTHAQPTLLKDLNPGAGSSYITENNMYNVGTDAVFVNTDDSSVSITDGSTAGTRVLFHYEPSTILTFSNPFAFCKVNNKLFYFMDANYDTTDLYYYDLTANTNHFVKAFKMIGMGFNNSHNWHYPVIEFQNKLVFSALAFEDANIVLGKGQELWESDGTAAGTKMMADVNFGTGSSMCVGFVKAYGSLFFIATTQIGSPTPSTRLWVTDGTAVGTVAHPGNIFFSPTTYHLKYRFLNNKLHVVSPDLITVGSNLSSVWRVESATSTANPSFSVYGLAGYGYYNNKYYFTGIPYNNGPADTKSVELYKIDYNIVSSTQAELVKDINTQPGAGAGSFVIETFNGKLYFVAHDETYNSQLWMTDGTDAGTTKLTNFKAKFNLNQLDQFTVINNKIYFMADDSTNGFELQMLDPATNAVTSYNIKSGDEPYNAPPYFLPVGNFAIYMYDDGTNGMEPWVIGAPNVTNAIANVEVNQSNRSVYPNPADGFVQFDADDNAYVRLYDMCGKLVLTHEFHGKEVIDVSMVKTGMVFYTIVNQNGEVTASGKFVKR